jgi:hypothetical protein
MIGRVTALFAALSLAMKHILSTQALTFS